MLRVEDDDKTYIWSQVVQSLHWEIFYLHELCIFELISIEMNVFSNDFQDGLVSYSYELISSYRIKLIIL